MTKLFIILFLSFYFQEQVFIPIGSENRKDISKIQLTAIGEFGLVRKARKDVPSHYHTGIDIKRPAKNYDNEPIYPIANGKVISKRTDGPYANIIIEHSVNGKKFWTLYEHISGIKAEVNDAVNPEKPIARFMNKAELDKHGWQFDHFHLEILKVKPQEIKPDKEHPGRFFNSYTLTCYTDNDLEKYYFEPLSFLEKHISK